MQLSSASSPVKDGGDMVRTVAMAIARRCLELRVTHGFEKAKGAERESHCVS